MLITSSDKMVREIFKHMRGNVFYPLCGTDVVWGECTNYGCSNIVFGDGERKALKKVNAYMKKTGMTGDCIRLDFEHLPFIKGSFQTVIYKPGPGITTALKVDTPILKEVIDPEVLVAVKTVGCKCSPEIPITNSYIEEFTRENGYELKETFQPEIEEDLPAFEFFLPRLVMIFEKNKS